LTRALWLEVGSAPIELMRLTLCRDVYHCTPSQLRAEKLRDILVDLTVIGEQNRIAKIKEQPRIKR
jgi:hypothetical protein